MDEELLELTDEVLDEKPIPPVITKRKSIPKKTSAKKEVPKKTDAEKELPKIGNPENVIVLGSEEIEIKPTKLKYQRNRDAVFYKIVETIPLPDILSMGAGAIDPIRDGDKCLFDWLIAVFDSSSVVVRHYDAMTTEDIEKILTIFKRINKITDKEEKAKNRLTKETA